MERPAGKVTVELPATATGTPAPPHVLPTFGVAAITTPPGKVSMSGAVSVAIVTSGLLNVTVSVETPPALTVARLKALPSAGGTTGVRTVSVAMAGPVLFPLLVTRAPASSVWMYEPPTAAVTSTVSVQLLLAAIERPAGKVTVELPATATGTPAPPQVLPTFGVAAITTPLCKVSMSGAVRVATAALALLKVTVSVETPPALTVAGLKALPSVGGTTGVRTVSVAIAGAELLPLLVTRAPASSVLMYELPTAAVTSTVSVQLLLAAIERPAGKVTVELPATATGTPAPPQVLPTFGVAAITTPLCKVSMSGAVRVATAALALLKVTVSVETPPALTVAALKALPSAGGTTGVRTVSVAMAGPVLFPLVVASAPAGSVLM